MKENHVAVSKKNATDEIVLRVLVISRKPADINKIKKVWSEILPGSILSSTGSISRLKKSFETIDLCICALGANDESRTEIIALLKTYKNIPFIVTGKTKTDIAYTVSKQQCTILLESFDKKSLSPVVKELIQKKQLNNDGNLNDIQTDQTRYLNVLLNSPDGISIVTLSGKILFINPAARMMLKLKSNTQRIRLPFKVASPGTQEISVRQSGSQMRCFEINVSEIKWEHEAALLISLRDCTSRKLAEDTVRANEERYILATRGAQSGLWDWDLQNDRIFYCDQWKEMLGIQCESISASPQEWFSRVHTEDIDGVKYAIDLHFGKKTSQFESEHRILHKDGTYRWVLVRGMAIFDKRGKPVRFAGSQTDITERKEAENELKKSLDDLKFALASEKLLMEELDRKNKELVELAITDGLTGMYNHRFLQERLDYEFKRVRRYGGLLSCMIIDIDHFKMINDTYGHQVGDQVLRQLAGIMKQKSREIDICGRYGGEEFMIITNLQMENALRYATKLHSTIEHTSFTYNGKNIRVTVSIGIAEYNSDVKTKQELIERADSAMYQAKMDGRNLIRIWKDIDATDDNSVDRYGIQELKGKFQDLSNQMRYVYMESTNALIKAVDAKDPYAKEHSQNVAAYSAEMAKLLQLSDADVEVVYYAGLLHDIGKIGIRDDIIIKKDELTSKEYELLRRHPEVGVNILRDIRFLEKEIPIILHHHERFDGKGYPHGLQGREIPLGARILAVADAFDAMTEGRSYQNKVPWKKALEEIKKGSGTQFAPEIVDAFIKLEADGKIIPCSKKEG
jgi:diguanylate cyclase (GGDEF)-like protein/PAS domain S-box-containing protein/putative nucleotidyltransferase with HDIG domain